MNMNMFNPEMMNQMKNMIDGKSMKNMLGNITNMTDDQIRVYLSASGMSHMSPQMFRQMAGQFKNMDENDLDRMKNMAPNAPRAGFPYQPNNSVNNTSNTNRTITSNANVKNEYSSNNINSSATSSQNDLNFSDPHSGPKNVIDKLERIKIEGNNFFRTGKYKEACEKYYEILNEMEYISDSEKVTYQQQLDDMEIVCRLNIANTKIKQEDYDLVIHECLKVLKKSENFKAHYRAGVAYYKKSSHQKAYHHLIKAKDLNKDGDVDIDKYLTECKAFLDEQEVEKKKSQLYAENKLANKSDTETMSTINNTIVNNGEETKQISESNQSKNVKDSNDLDEIKLNNTKNINQDINSYEIKKTSSKIEKLKEIVNKEVKAELPNNTNIKQNDDILVEDKVDQNASVNNSQQTFNPGFMPNIPNNMTEKMSQMQKELENMDDSQFTGMVGMLRGMDNSTIKSMMSMQGMNLSDEQIEMMKNVNPQMLQMAKKNQMHINPTGINTNMTNQSITNNSLSNDSVASTVPNRNISNNNPIDQTNAFPNLNNMDMNGMLKMIQDNPQIMNMMGPQMANMFGGNGGNQQVMMNSMQNILWLISLPQRIKAFITSPRGILFISIVLILIIAYFYNR